MVYTNIIAKGIVIILSIDINITLFSTTIQIK